MIFSRLVDRLARRFTDLHERLEAAERAREALVAEVARLEGRIGYFDDRVRGLYARLSEFEAKETEYVQTKERDERQVAEIVAMNDEIERLKDEVRSLREPKPHRRNGRRAHV